MNKKLQKTILAGIAATSAMTMLTYMAPLMGLPEMNAPAMLSGMMGASVVLGWLGHFMIGTVFAVGYSFLFAPTVGIHNTYIKGAVYGITIFVFAQIMMIAMGALMGGMQQPEGSKASLVLGSVMGHVLYGVVLALVVSGRRVAPQFNHAQSA